MYLSLEALRPTIRTSYPIVVKLINLVNSVILKWLTFLFESPNLSFLLFWIYLFLLMLVFALTSFLWCCFLSFHWLAFNFKRAAQFMTILVLIRTVIVIIWQMLLLMLNFLNGPWSQVGIDSYIPHCQYQVKSHLSRLSAVCAAAIAHKNHFFCTNRINLQHLEWINCLSCIAFM